MPVKRTTHRSTAGKKLYAVRDAEGQFKDIQTYERAHRQDLKKTSKAEATKAAGAKKAAKKAVKKAVKKAAPKKTAAKKTVAKKAAAKKR
jgi:hypothetical protein